MVRRFALASLLLAAAAPAFAGDRSACRKARRVMTVEGWTRYVMAEPYGRCQDEALGQLIVLTVGRLAGRVAGDPTQMALALAQVAHSSPEELQALTSMFGGGGLGGLGALGALGGTDVSDTFGVGGLGGFGGLGGEISGPSGLGSYGDSGDYGVLGALSDASIMGYVGDDGGRQIYVSYYADQVDGGWNEAEFWDALDQTRPALESCWQELGVSPMGVYYVARFELAGGRLSVRGIEQTYSDDGSKHAEVEACVRSSLETATFPTTYAGTYAYRVELY